MECVNAMSFCYSHLSSATQGSVFTSKTICFQAPYHILSPSMSYHIYALASCISNNTLCFDGFFLHGFTVNSLTTMCCHLTAHEKYLECSKHRIITHFIEGNSCQTAAYRWWHVTRRNQEWNHGAISKMQECSRKLIIFLCFHSVLVSNSNITYSKYVCVF